MFMTKTTRFAIVAILLWVVTIAVFAWFFIRGNTIAGADGRAAVVLHADERAFVLAEMRSMLAATQGILEGVNKGDLKKVMTSASAAGMSGTAEVNPALMTKLPLSFKTLGLSLHHDMDDIAEAAAKGKPVTEIQNMLATTLTKCIACHSAWQLETEK